MNFLKWLFGITEQPATPELRVDLFGGVKDLRENDLPVFGQAVSSAFPDAAKVPSVSQIMSPKPMKKASIKRKVKKSA